MNRVEAQAHGVARGDSDIARGGEECLFVNLQVSGVGVMRQCGREVAARPGELILWDSAQPWSIDQPDALHALSLSIPYRLLGKRGEQARNVVVRPYASFSPVLSRLLAGQMSVLAAHGHDLDADEAIAVADTLVELVGALTTTDPARSNARHGLARRACVEIERRYVEADLTPGVVAESLRVSLRVLHESFAQQNQTFMDTLYRFRLQRAHALLTRRNQERCVAEIAQLCGFRVPGPLACTHHCAVLSSVCD